MLWFLFINIQLKLKTHFHKKATKRIDPWGKFHELHFLGFPSQEELTLKQTFKAKIAFHNTCSVLKKK